MYDSSYSLLPILEHFIMEQLVILGASGSIGASTLDIVKNNPSKF